MALAVILLVAPTGAAPEGCRGKRAGGGNAGAASNTRQNSNAGERATMGREFKLGHGQEAEVEGAGLRVRFSSVADDSRCPVGVNCIWEGDAEVRLDVRAAAGGGEGRQVTLHTSDRFGREARHAGHVFRLVALAPQPKADEKLKPGDYVLTLTVTKE